MGTLNKYCFFNVICLNKYLYMLLFFCRRKEAEPDGGADQGARQSAERHQDVQVTL